MKVTFAKLTLTFATFSLRLAGQDATNSSSNTATKDIIYYSDSRFLEIMVGPLEDDPTQKFFFV